MKIALVCSYDLTRSGGVQAHVLGLSAELRRRGHQVWVLSPPPSRHRPIRRPGLVQIGHSWLTSWPGGTEIELALAYGEEKQFLKRLLDQERFEIIHYHNPFILSHQISSLARGANVITLHTTPPPTLAGRLITVLATLYGCLWWRKRLSGGIAISESSARWVRPYWRLGRLPVIPNGVDTARFREAQPFVEWQDDHKNLLYLGRFEKRKGVDTLLRAFSEISRRFPKTRLLLAGSGPEESGLRDLCAALGLVGSSEVVFLGRVSEEEKPRWYATCDIFCAPALHGESFGIVLVEAMAAGKPVVAAANSGYSTVLTGPGAKLLFPPANVPALVDRLSSLLENEGLQKRYGNWGLEASRRYTWSTVGEEVEAVYREAYCRVEAVH